MENQNSTFIDILMRYDEDKEYFDLSITDTGDIEADNSFDTTMNCALLTDGRADSSEVSAVERQRGTIVDIFTNGRNGSKLWLLEQSRADLNSKNRAVDYAKKALQFLVDEGYCKNIVVTGSLKEKGISLGIVVERLSGVFDKYRYDAWNASMYKEGVR